MKKSYISPELVIVKLAPSKSILLLSKGDEWSIDDAIIPDDPIDPGKVEVKGFTNNLSNIWDEEW